MSNLTGLDIFNLVASITSIILAILAIILSMVFFFSSKRAELQARLALRDIEKATKSLDSLSMKLISRLTTYAMTPSSTEQSLLDLLSKNLGPTTNLSESDDVPSNPTNAQLNQLRVDNLITAFYYASVSNVSLQNLLPPNMAQLSSIGGIVQLIDQSKADAQILKDWIIGSQELLNSSRLKHLYNEALALENSLKTVTEFYTDLGAGVVPPATPTTPLPK